MSEEAGLLAVDRVAYRRVLRGVDGARRSPLTGQTLDETLSCYGGVEGELWPGWVGDWPFEDALLPMAHAARYTDYLDGLGPQVEILGVARGESASPEGWSLWGYDVAVVESPWSVFSVVLNELLFGALARLGAYRERLNERLLLRRREHAEELVERHLAAEREGADVEALGRPVVLAMYEPRAASMRASWPRVAMA
ncbi:MAG: hypothetical protein R3B72_37665 [Polyangiaceae bacterium]